MTAAIDPVELTTRLAACPSVTPATGEVFDVLEAALAPLGFHVHRFVLGEAPDGPVENLFATRGSGSPHFALPAYDGPIRDGWTSDPFQPEIRGGLLQGRGVVDMKRDRRIRRPHADVADHRGTSASSSPAEGARPLTKTEADEWIRGGPSAPT